MPPRRRVHDDSDEDVAASQPAKRSKASESVFSQVESSQAASNDKVSSEEFEALATDIVRHILFLHTRKLPLDKKHLKDVIGDRRAPRSYNQLLKRATQIFQSSLGLELVELTKPPSESERAAESESASAGTGQYILRMPMAPAAAQGDRQIKLRTHDEAERGFLTVVLGVLVLSENQELETETFWRLMNDKFGVTKLTKIGPLGYEYSTIAVDLMEKRWTQQQYIDKSRLAVNVRAGMSQGTQVDDRRFAYRIGARAHREVRSRHLLAHIQRITDSRLTPEMVRGYCFNDSESEADDEVQEFDEAPAPAPARPAAQPAPVGARASSRLRSG
jgi:hypothetical protein